MEKISNTLNKQIKNTWRHFKISNTIFKGITNISPNKTISLNSLYIIFFLNACFPNKFNKEPGEKESTKKRLNMTRSRSSKANLLFFKQQHYKTTSFQ